MNDVVEPIGVALVHFLWQGCAVASLLALALRLTRDSSANVRYALSVAALVLLTLLPVATAARAFGNAAAMSGRPVTRPHELSQPASSFATADTVPSVTSDAAPVARWLRAESIRFGVVTLWMIGVLVFTTLHSGAWLRIRRMRGSGVPVDDPSWDPWIAELRERMGVDRLVRVVKSARVDVPTLLGWARPVILIPTSALLGMSQRSLEALLLHELAHVRRHDFLVNLLQAAVETLLFYHPAVWWVSHRVRSEREHCCDDLAVRSCGSRQDYVRALADMERLRLATPRMALAADGGSLVERIRRLTDSNPQENNGKSGWAMGVGIVALCVAIGAVHFASLPAASARPASTSTTLLSPAQTNGSEAAPGDAIEGTWRARLDSGDVWLELRLDGRRNHRNSLSIDSSRFTGTGDDGIPGFLLRPDAGAFHFEGRLDGSDRWSRYEFRPDPAYAERMRALGFDAPSSPERLYDLAVIDVSLEFAEGIRDAGYGDISIDRLMEFRIHGVTPEFVKAMAETGFDDLSPSRLVEFRIHGVSPEFVKAMADSGFEGLSASRLVEFRIHGVSPEFVKAMADSGFEGLSASRLVEFRIHGVTPEFVKAMADSGFDGSPQRLVEFRIHGVSPEFVRRMQEAGLDDLSPSRLVEFRIHGVSAEFVSELAELGYGDVSASRLVEMRIHGVGPEFIRDAQAEYGDDLTVRELIEMRIHGRGRAERY